MEFKSIIKKFIPHIISIVLFIIISLIYFYPAAEGKVLQQSDIQNFKGMSEEIKDYRDKTGEEALWTNSMFGGMPAFQISVVYSNNLISKVDDVLQLGIPRPANLMFLSLIGFYFLLVVMGANVYLSFLGAVAFSLSSYFFIIIDAGHMSKAHTIAYMAPVVAGILLTYKGKLIPGGIITAIAMALQINANHFQITYYLFLTLLIYALILFFISIKEKTLKLFFKASLVTSIAVFLAILPNISLLWSTYSYTKYTTRGKSELTFNKADQTSGLDKSYATAWSYGIDETFTLLIPNFKGGSSHASLSESSETFKVLRSQGYPKREAEAVISSMPMYWGTQTFTSGPVYVGAIILFLFVLGLFVVKGKYKWWLLSATILSIVLAWGKNFMPVTDFFLDYFPLYNKFRAVSMTLVIAQFTIPLLAILTLKEILSKEIQKETVIKGLKYSLIIVGGICLFFAIFSTYLYDFISLSDASYPKLITDAWQIDRKDLFISDSIRSLIFIVLVCGVIWAYLKEKIQTKYVILSIALLIIIDLWSVGKRYLNNNKIFNPSTNREESKWISKRAAEKSFQESNIDFQILSDNTLHYRVLNLTARFDQDAPTSYFHKNLGGYHGAKLKKYQEMIDIHFYRNNMTVYNMLNAKYIITPKQDGAGNMVQYNYNALGNAWFISEIKVVDNADQEIMALFSPNNIDSVTYVYNQISKFENLYRESAESKNSTEKVEKYKNQIYYFGEKLNKLTNFNPKKTAIINKKYSNYIKNLNLKTDTINTNYIQLSDYKPNKLVYDYDSKNDQLVVFSEIYYGDGWNAYIDGKLTEHINCNYILRALKVPSGKHEIVFKFEPKSYFIGEKIALAGSLLILLIVGYGIFLFFKNNISK